MPFHIGIRTRSHAVCTGWVIRVAIAIGLAQLALVEIDGHEQQPAVVLGTRRASRQWRQVGDRKRIGQMQHHCGAFRHDRAIRQFERRHLLARIDGPIGLGQMRAIAGIDVDDPVVRADLGQRGLH